MTWLKIAAVNLAVLFGLVVVFEGSVSVFLFFRDITVLAWEAAPYSEYDPDLGWIAKPNVVLPDFWKKGVGVRTNDQRFRATKHVAAAVPSGETRVICSGDSFTFGDGVNNADTWCQQLQSRDGRIDPVNLGQGGYGADQAYLRFLRDTKTLEYHIQVFAFINDDFKRMQSAKFLGIDKPVLALENGVPKAANVPVPRTFTSHMWLNSIPRALQQTRSGVLAQRVLNKYGPPNPTTSAEDGKTLQVMSEMFLELKRVNQKRGSRLFLVHLPTLDELGGVDAWSRYIHAAAEAEDIPLIDVVTAFRSRTDARSLFLTETTAASHYNTRGHALVADTVYLGIQEALRR
jgi:hypothetical protein